MKQTLKTNFLLSAITAIPHRKDTMSIDKTTQPAQWGYVQARAPAGDLLPCPFCGGDVDIACVELMSSRDGGPVYVHCDVCGADGPQHDWADDAKADWNRRTQAPAVEAAPQPEAQPHADDIAVDAFASAMKGKLAAARDKGRHGWQECSQADLTEMLHEHVAKGDPRDVANFCMFLWSLGYGIKPVSGMSYTESMAFSEGFQAGYKRAAPSAQAEQKGGE